jgi:NAD(P)-dependent dehydrogenase (short-subunit alcohol dehydrogenase family)
MLLTLELLPLFLETAASSGDGRIVFVSSRGHAMAQSFDASRLNLEEDDYARFQAYNNSKLYNVCCHSTDHYRPIASTFGWVRPGSGCGQV